jgi:hypothetical protein
MRAWLYIGILLASGLAYSGETADPDAAVDALERSVIADAAPATAMTNPDVIAEALYWLYHSQRELRLLESAYQTAKRLTWEYPGSRWARALRPCCHSYDYAAIERRLSE